MPNQLHQLIAESAARTPDAPALLFKDQTLTYRELWRAVSRVAQGLKDLGLIPGDRVAVYLPKQPETVITLFAASAAGCVFVPVNPVLKAEQVGYLLRHCDVKALITSATRASGLGDEMAQSPALARLVLIDQPRDGAAVAQWIPFADLLAAQENTHEAGASSDVAAILYTSGSTGQPKGVTLTHANMLAGARSVAEYLNNQANDRLLAVLPLSFDYGLSQLTTAFLVGASVVLMDYLLPRDVIKAVARYQVTGLAAVPPLWNQLAGLPWPPEAVESLRYITNSGGAMPQTTLAALREALPQTDVFLMYGLTEAFRSTYLDPAEIDRRPGSMGKAIPHAQVLVLRPDGSECADDEVGELVHLGPLVSLGYWNDPDKTAARFKPASSVMVEGLLGEVAVWSGDRVRRDREGFLYFEGRNDEMVKTSGYRVSPGEIEAVVAALEAVEQAVAFGVPHPMLGQGIVLVVDANCEVQMIRQHCQQHLPQYMLPGHVVVERDLPRNANGKIDRKALAQLHQTCFED